MTKEQMEMAVKVLLLGISQEGDKEEKKRLIQAAWETYEAYKQVASKTEVGDMYITLFTQAPKYLLFD